MALGQSGPPASAKQISYLQALLDKAGYGGLREARHPLGLTQRQAGGKFTKLEASELIDRLVNGDTSTEAVGAARLDRASATQAQILKGMPAQWLADELLSRGWSVKEPT